MELRAVGRRLREGMNKQYISSGGNMPGRSSAITIELDEPTRIVLDGWLQRQKTPFGLVKRVQAILSLSQGHGFIATARHVGLTERHVHSPRIAQRDDNKEAVKGKSSQRGKNVPP